MKGAFLLLCHFLEALFFCLKSLTYWNQELAGHIVLELPLGAQERIHDEGRSWCRSTLLYAATTKNAGACCCRCCCARCLLRVVNCAQSAQVLRHHDGDDDFIINPNPMKC